MSMTPSQHSTMKVRTLPFWAILGLLTVVHASPSNLVAQEEVYREAVTDGYIIDNSYFDSLTTESPKTPGVAWASQQPFPEEQDTMEASGDTGDKVVMYVDLQYGGKSTTATPSAWSTEGTSLESKESELLEGSGDTIDTFVFLQNGSKGNDTTTTSVPLAGGTEQPSLESKENDLLQATKDTTNTFVYLRHGGNQHVSSTTSASPALSKEKPSRESKESDLLEAIGDTNIKSVFTQHGGKHHMTTTTSASPAQQSKESYLLEGSGDVTDDTSLQINKTVVNQSVLSVKEPLKVDTTPLPSVGSQTPAWAIILAFVGGVASLVMICIAIATRDKWNAPNKALSPNSESKMKSISQQKDEMETLMHKDQPKENGRMTEYTVIPLDELPEKYSSD